jgi:hypothetical protein
MNIKKTLFLCFTFSFITQSCQGMGSDLGLKASKILAPNLQNLGRNFGLSTWLSIKETIDTSASYAMSTTQNLAQSHPYIAGIFSISSIGYMGYRFLMNHLDAKSLLQLRKSEMKIAEENARIARPCNKERTNYT